MRWDEIEMRWVEFRRLVKRRWTDLSEAELEAINGRRELLVHSLQASYGVSRDAAEQQIEGWCTTFGDAVEEATDSTRAIERMVLPRPSPAFYDHPRSGSGRAAAAALCDSPAPASTADPAPPVSRE